MIKIKTRKYQEKVLKFANKSKTYCPLLWNHTCIKTDKSYDFCCVAQHHPHDLDEQYRNPSAGMSIDEWWNSDEINKARKDMLNGKKPAQCTHCWKLETADIKSPRHDALESLGIIKGLTWKTTTSSKVEKSFIKSSSKYIINSSRIGPVDPESILRKMKITNDNTESTVQNKAMLITPASYDIKFGNLCNLKCRMCHASSSSQINKEAKQHEDEHKTYPHTYEDESQFTWFLDRSASFWKDFEKKKDVITDLKFTGGEPLLIETLIKFLHELVNNGLSKKISLNLITNATTVNKELIEKVFTHFYSVKLNVSVDGTGDVYDYIRYPGRWKTLDKNLRLLTKYPYLQVSISPTIQVLNCINFIDILAYAEELNALSENKIFAIVQPTINYVEYPWYHSITNMSSEERQLLHEYYKYHENNDVKVKHKTHKKVLNDLADYVLQARSRYPKYVSKCREEFIKYTATLDKIRNQSFKQGCKREWKFYNEGIISDQ
jgi:MoaA/NifB/PqqE/SkfB family radical SAM enzyme